MDDLLSEQTPKLIFFFIFALTIYQSMQHAEGQQDQISTVERVKVSDDLIEMIKARNVILANPDNISIVASTPITEISSTQLTQSTAFTTEPWSAVPDNFTFCNKKPKFKLGSGSIITFMLRLKLCQFMARKPWFEEACEDREYNITDYYSAVYAKFCQPYAFLDRCKGIGEEKKNHSDNSLQFLQRWMRQRKIKLWEVNATLGRQNSSSFVFFDTNYCNSIESYFYSLEENDTRTEKSTTDRNEQDAPFSNVQYTEWFLTYRPFCESVACGVSLKDYKDASLTAYDCATDSCRPAIVFVMVFDSILALVIVVANVLVLLVAARTPIMRNIPGYFKISLAVADLIVGVFVLPGSVYHHHVLSMEALPYRQEGQMPHATDYFNQYYLNFMGFFTVLSFSVSVYTMGAASMDRYLAITRPFRYRQGKYLTTQRSVVVFVVIWLFGILLGIYPVFTRHHYTISALGLTLSTGMTAIVVYAMTLGLPLLAVWCINGLMLSQVCREGKRRRSMSAKHMTANRTVSERVEPECRKVVSSAYYGNNNLSRLPTTDTTVNDDVFEDANKLSKNRIRSVVDKFKNIRKSKNEQTVPSRGVKPSLQKTSSSMSNTDNVERRLAKTLAVMIGAFTIALLPGIIVLSIQPALGAFISPQSFPKSYSSYAANVYMSAEYVASRLFLSNSFWNCIIYSIRNRHFRRALVDSFICNEEHRRHRRQSASRTISSSSSKINPKGKQLKKMASSDSWFGGQSNAEIRRDTQVWDLSNSSRKNSDESKTGSNIPPK
ncbi:uncharacterized protein LOC143462742 [Clavelina lepadiformis]|uniref:G-protein coupled receptors family 1 profile domain-containing protein n=1 Tax=Clavelina lepadiformis TaxID=159417 RepID=A0ABP0GNS9_CLALP